MARTQVNIKRLVDNIRKTNAYTPLVEAIANSIDSIDDVKREDGEIIVTFFRSNQGTLGVTGDELKPFDRVSICDNGTGFTDANLNAFNEIYTEKKVRYGGKGFGRFVFLKYFNSVEIESVYVERGSYHSRKFNFVKDNEIIQNLLTDKVIGGGTVKTTITLTGLRIEHINKIDKTIETISRKLLEKLLVHLVIDGHKCPRIIVKEDGSQKAITLNNYINDESGVSFKDEKEFFLESVDKSIRKNFKVKVFKIFFGESRSSINLVADKRQVTEEALYTYVPEFRDDFYEIEKKEDGKEITKNYKIKAYVTGQYLDEHVSLERDGFDFSSSSSRDLFFPFSQGDIEKEVAKVTGEIFGSEVKTRQKKKEIEVIEYVDKNAPWHKSNLVDLDLTKLPYKPTDEEIDSALEEVRFRKEQSTKTELKAILANEDEKEVAKKVDEILTKITDVQKNELTHYVALRRVILDLLKKSLKWNADKKYEKEKVIHDIIFPTHSTSDTLPYDKHNLWLIDEKLSFTEYVSSDKPLNLTPDRPDILVFDNKIVVRDGDTLSNPIIVFELKKPQRDNYTPAENPLLQIAEYIKKIKNGDFKNFEGRNIYANQDTPAFGFLVCDLTDDIKNFCELLGLTKSPDNKGYFGFHANYKIYFQVTSFDKLVEDSEIRNKIFFKKVGIV